MNFQTICRICICECSAMQSIFESCNFTADNCEIFKVITNCASVQIQKFDGFSEQICRRCLQDLSQAYNFKKLCEDSDYKFRNHLITSNIIEAENKLQEPCDIEIKIENHSDNDEDRIEEQVVFKSEDCEESSSLIGDPDENFGSTGIKTEPFGEENKSDEEEFEAAFKSMECLTQPSKNGASGSYKCKICSKSLATTRYLTLHMKVHTGQQPYKCDVCSRKFLLSTGLAIHMRTHSGEKPYKCEVCHKQFTQSSNLSRHVRLHTGEMPYQCDVCGKKFTQKVQLVGHLKLHAGETPFKCEFCDKKFTRNDTLTRHVRIHTGEHPYKCDFCEEQFKRKDHLLVHVRLHTGEKPFKCSVCDKAFRDKSNLVVHIRSHTGEKPYKCEFCEKTFSQSSHLTTHRREIHVVML